MGNIGGIIVGVLLVTGLITAMGMMSSMDADANKNICTGDCKSCKENLKKNFAERRLKKDRNLQPARRNQ